MPTSFSDRMRGGLMGLIVGDALGVPAEFQSRQSLQENPITDMIGHGSHNQPAGTWSDDSSMALCTVETLLERGIDPDATMKNFQCWLLESHMTPHGKVFDVGTTTREAIFRYAAGTPALECGGSDDFSNGNGSLMRILPVSLFVAGESEEKIIRTSFDFSAMTHRHIRSQLCCAIYSLAIRRLLQGTPMTESLADAMRRIEGMIPEPERPIFSRLLDGSILRLTPRASLLRRLFRRVDAEDGPDDIRSGGHVIDTLEAALWCCAKTASFRDSVLKAVNLGRDTDTTAAVTGGLAGTLYGVESIPKPWIQQLAKIEMIQSLLDRFVSRLSGNRIVEGKDNGHV